MLGIPKFLYDRSDKLPVKRKLTPAERFSGFVPHSKLPTNDQTVCWPWRGAWPNSTGSSGRLIIAGKEVRGHRFAYENFIGPIPDGMHVLRTCGNKRCCRPDHLGLGKVAGHHATGEASPNSKLSQADVKGIRAKAEAGASLSGLAAEYGVSKTSVFRITKRQTWRHVL